jgi:hypothetical protein
MVPLQHVAGCHMVEGGDHAARIVVWVYQGHSYSHIPTMLKHRPHHGLHPTPTLLHQLHCQYTYRIGIPVSTWHIKWGGCGNGGAPYMQPHSYSAFPV